MDASQLIRACCDAFNRDDAQVANDRDWPGQLAPLLQRASVD